MKIEKVIKTVDEMNTIINDALYHNVKVYYAYNEIELFGTLPSQRITNYIFIGNDIDNLRCYELDKMLFAYRTVFQYLTLYYCVDDPFIFAGYVIRHVYWYHIIRALRPFNITLCLVLLNKMFSKNVIKIFQKVLDKIYILWYTIYVNDKKSVCVVPWKLNCLLS